MLKSLILVSLIIFQGFFAAAKASDIQASANVQDYAFSKVDMMNELFPGLDVEINEDAENFNLVLTEVSELEGVVLSFNDSSLKLGDLYKPSISGNSIKAPNIKINFNDGINTLGRCPSAECYAPENPFETIKFNNNYLK